MGLHDKGVRIASFPNVRLGKKHRDKTRVQMPTKMFPHLKLLCLLFMGPILGFDTKKRSSFLSNLVLFTIKARF
jgi:hypothetical protein